MRRMEGGLTVGASDSQALLSVAELTHIMAESEGEAMTGKRPGLALWRCLTREIPS